MAINPYFTESGSTAGQKDLYEDLIIESIKIYGQTFYYVPREIIREDTLFGEDQLAQFNDSYEVEMYIENKSGFDGGELFQKFGVEIRDDATVVVSKKRWIEEVVTNGGESLTRPREGDLLFFPTANALFEINFVEHEQPFYQLKNLPVYKLNISLFEYDGEDIDLDQIEVQIGDDLITNGGFDTSLDNWTVESGTVTFEEGEAQLAGVASLIQNNIIAAGTSGKYRLTWDQTVIAGTRSRIRFRNADDLADIFPITYYNGSGPQSQTFDTTDGFSIKLITEAPDTVKFDNVKLVQVETFNEQAYASTYVITVADSTGYEDGETITQVNGTINVTAEIQSIDGNDLIVSNVGNDTSGFVIFAVGENVTGGTSAAVSNVTAVASFDDGYSDNDAIETESSTITAFDPDNPFGSF